MSLLKTDVSEEPGASTVKLEIISELRTTLTITSYLTTSHKIALFKVTAVKTSNLTIYFPNNISGHIQTLVFALIREIL
jgi:hypothetical protein